MGKFPDSDFIIVLYLVKINNLNIMLQKYRQIPLLKQRLESITTFVVQLYKPGHTLAYCFLDNKQTDKGYMILQYYAQFFYLNDFLFLMRIIIPSI